MGWSRGGGGLTKVEWRRKHEIRKMKTESLLHFVAVFALWFLRRSVRFCNKHNIRVEFLLNIILCSGQWKMNILFVYCKYICWNVLQKRKLNVWQSCSTSTQWITCSSRPTIFTTQFGRFLFYFLFPPLKNLVCLSQKILIFVQVILNL